MIPLSIACGMVVGGLIWLWLIRPRQLDAYERERREYGLPRRRKLPEDG